MTGLVPFKVLILVSNERGFVQQQRFLLYLDIVLRIQDRKHKSALNLFCHLSEAVEVQGILLFQELDSNVAVGPDVRLGQVFRPLQKPVVEWDQSVKIVGFAAKFTAEFGFFHCKSNDFVLQLKKINLLNRWPDDIMNLASGAPYHLV